MNRLEYDRLRDYVVDKAQYLTDQTSALHSLFDDGYAALFAEPETDFEAFDDGDSGPSTVAMGPEVEDGIFNFVVHLVKNYSTSMTPEQARERVAAWLEAIAQGLRQFAQPEE